MADWYVYQHDGDPLGPWSTDTVASKILSGALAPDAWVAAPSGHRWLRALDVPVIARLVDGVPTTPGHRASGPRTMPAACVPTLHAMPDRAATVMMLAHPDFEPPSGPTSSASTARGVLPADETSRRYGVAPVDDEPTTERALPPSSSTPEPPTPVKKASDTGAMPSTDRGLRRKNA